MKRYPKRQATMYNSITLSVLLDSICLPAWIIRTSDANGTDTWSIYLQNAQS